MSSQAPADWYPDPFGRFETRYWDGHAWTKHVAMQGRQAVDAATDRPPTPVVTAAQAAAAWYPDPFGRFETRYWDGQAWTEHVAARGRPAVDAPVAATPEAPQRTAYASTPPGGGMRAGPQVVPSGEPALLTEPLLVVSQKAKVVGTNVAYAVRDQHGRQIGSLQEVGRGVMRKTMDRHRGRTDSTRAYKLQVLDETGRVVMAMARPVDRWKSKMTVIGPTGAPFGQIVEESFGVAGAAATFAHSALTGWSNKLDSKVEGLDKVGHARFRFEAGEHVLGAIHAEEVDAWNFKIRDSNGTEVARITKSWAGWLKERFTNADNYVLEVHEPLRDPLRSLVVAAALAVDIALKQGDPTSGSWGSRRYH